MPSSGASHRHEEIRTRVLAGQIEDVRSFRLETLEWVKDANDGILLDLSQLEWMSGSCLRVLVTVSERLEADGRRLALYGLNPRIRRALDIAGMEGTLPVHASRRAARDWLGRKIHVSRISRLADALLRVEEPIGGEEFAPSYSPRRPQRSSLAAELLKDDVQRVADGGRAGRPRKPSAGTPPIESQPGSTEGIDDA